MGRNACPSWATDQPRRGERRPNPCNRAHRPTGQPQTRGDAALGSVIPTLLGPAPRGERRQGARSPIPFSYKGPAPRGEYAEPRRASTRQEREDQPHGGGIRRTATIGCVLGFGPAPPSGESTMRPSRRATGTSDQPRARGGGCTLYRYERSGEGPAPRAGRRSWTTIRDPIDHRTSPTRGKAGAHWLTVASVAGPAPRGEDAEIECRSPLLPPRTSPVRGERITRYRRTHRTGEDAAPRVHSGGMLLYLAYRVAPLATRASPHTPPRGPQGASARPWLPAPSAPSSSPNGPDEYLPPIWLLIMNARLLSPLRSGEPNLARPALDPTARLPHVATGRRASFLWQPRRRVPTISSGAPAPALRPRSVVVGAPHKKDDNITIQQIDAADGADSLDRSVRGAAPVSLPQVRPGPPWGDGPWGGARPFGVRAAYAVGVLGNAGTGSAACVVRSPRRPTASSSRIT